ncbi:MAG: IS200/IS605 family transposase [Pyrinomonadaceae bacterium]
MANTFSSTYLHFVFSTKLRKKLIDREIESRVWKYIGGILRNYGMSALRIGGIEDHIHALVQTLPKFSASKIAQLMKTDSSRWIKDEFDRLQFFSWQDGYGVFSVSHSDIESVVDYIRNERIHHEGKSFEDEYRELMDLHAIEFEEKYLLG